MSNCLPRRKEYSGTTKIWLSGASVLKNKQNCLQHLDQKLVETTSFVIAVVNATPYKTPQLSHTKYTDHCDEHRHFVCEHLKTEHYQTC